jgi:DNA-binding SARP family transcriptional activator
MFAGSWGATVHFAILGSLEVRSSEARIAINAPKQRAVLATLLLSVNSEVGVDRLAKYVWDGRPPSALQTTLQSYIYRLRQRLRVLPGVQLETGPSSYTLCVDPAETDVWYFRQRVNEAHTQVHNGQLRAAAAQLRAATAVWRGAALAGVPGDSFRQEAQFLEDERVAAYEDLFGIEMAVGEHRKIVPELLKVASAYEYHEPLKALLMQALYLSGRQAEALHVYAGVRRRLRADLGIEPGPELQGLQQAILEQAPAERFARPPSRGRR